jgi:thiamine kinase-like enzyme
MEAGIGAKVVVFLLPEGHLVTRYLANARTLTLDEFTGPEMIPRVAERLRDIHALDPIAGAFDPYADIRRWLDIADRQQVPRPGRLAPLLEQVADIERVRAPMREQRMVFCHNDPYFLNFLDDGSLRVIDWEYAGMGDPMYDLAGVGHLLDGAGRHLLLESYFGETDNQRRRDLDDLIAVYICWNVAWTLVQIDFSEIDFDYVAFLEELLDKLA